MGANTTQAVGITLTLIGFTVLAGGFAGGGIILWILGLVILAGGLAAFMKCKPLEHQE
jgi:hypothetical protein